MGVWLVQLLKAIVVAALEGVLVFGLIELFPCEGGFICIFLKVVIGVIGTISIFCIAITALFRLGHS
jgi:hypothetical protein